MGSYGWLVCWRRGKYKFMTVKEWLLQKQRKEIQAYQSIDAEAELTIILTEELAKEMIKNLIKN